jgi:hypothetical protein
MKKILWILVGVLMMVVPSAGAEVVTFDDLNLDPESFYNGSDGAGEFESNGVVFNIFYDDEFGPYWEGMAYSNTTDTTTPDFTNQYSAITGAGADNSSIYGVAYLGFFGIVPTITFEDEVNLARAYITNTTYAFFAMQDGNAPAKKFGGADGGDPDWYLLTITGKDADGEVSGVIEFYLADFRFNDDTQDYIVDEWTAVDLSDLGKVKTVEFSVSSSDVGDFGINTPTYFAIDSIVIDADDNESNGGNGGSNSTCFIQSLSR